MQHTPDVENIRMQKWFVGDYFLSFLYLLCTPTYLAVSNIHVTSHHTIRIYLRDAACFPSYPAGAVRCSEKLRADVHRLTAS